MPDLVQLFTPERIEEFEDYIKVDDIYCRLLTIDVLPEFICYGWFNGITTLGGVTVSVSLHPYTQKDASDRIAKWQTILGSELQLAHKHGETTKIGTLETKYNFYYNLLTDINLRRNNIIAATVTIMITAPSYKELIYKCNQVKDMLGATRAITMYYRQLEGFVHTLPFISSLSECHDVTVANTTCLSPLISTDFTHPSGIYFGVNETGSPVFLDLYIGSPRLYGLHMFITGSTRSGKSFTVKGVTSRSMAHGVSVVIIDPEGEYKKLAEEMDGVLVKFKPDMKCMFNIFDIEPEEDEETKRQYVDIAGKSEDICQLISSILNAQTGEKISAEERALAGKAVRDEYLERGITENPESIYLPSGKMAEDGGVYIGKSYKEMPTISSYAARLRNINADRLANILIPYCKGGGMGFFDGQSIGNFYDSQLVVFDVSSLKTEFQRMYSMYVMLSWVWEKFVKKSKKRKLVVVDEAWLMMRYKDTAKFLSDLARRGAKYNTSLMVASQSFREFTTEEGKVLMAQCDTKFFLKMQHTDAQELGILFNLPTGVVSRIETFQPGQGIIKAGLESAIVTFKGFSFEEHFLRSDPEAVLAR